MLQLWLESTCGPPAFMGEKMFVLDKKKFEIQQVRYFGSDGLENHC